MTQLRQITFFISLVFLLNSCNHQEVPGGEISIKNDIMDKEYNSFIIDKVMLSDGASSFSTKIKPSEQVILPRKGVESFRITRKYEDHSKVYQVSCPKGFKRKITMKLIDIHLNKIDGGCSLSRKGTIKDGFTKWEDQ